MENIYQYDYNEFLVNNFNVNSQDTLKYVEKNFHCFFLTNLQKRERICKKRLNHKIKTMVKRAAPFRTPKRFRFFFG